MNAEKDMRSGMPGTSSSEPGWLADWKTAEREPVFFSRDPREWRFIEAMWLRDAVAFHR
jgi:hypothetical protein